MSKIKNLINRITEFGTNPNVESENKTDEIQKLLVGLYSEYLNLNADFDDSDFDEEPDFDYKVIRRNLESNFPDFGLYGKVFDINKVDQKTELATGDAFDDLTDIIKDLLVVKWKFEHTSEIDAIWDFEFSMRTHSEQHLVDLLKYLKEKS